MPLDLTAKKSNAISKIVELANTGMAIALKIQEAGSFLTDNGMLTGGPNALQDADFVGENSHIDAASFNAAVTALQTLTLNNANKTLLRKINKTVIPTSSNN